MHLPDWLASFGLPHYLAAGGGIVVLLALILYCTPASRLKMPGIILGILGGMGVGAALGVVGMAYYEHQQKQQAETEETPPSGGNPGGPPPGMMGMMGRGGMPGGGGMPGMGGRPNPKAQLATLVAKLDVLTHEPLEVKLNAEQQKKVREQLRKLDEPEDLKDEEAKARLDALLDVLKDQRATLEAAGYRWPGQGGGGPGQGGGGPGGRGGRQGPGAANPFKDGENGKHLKALQSRLEKK